MKKMMIIWGILAISLVATLTYIGLKFEDSVKEYKILENDMIEAADAYMQLSDIILNPGESIKISSDKLMELSVATSMEVKDDFCVGYVLVEKDFNKNNYSAFIKCNEYTTLDYEKNE